MKWPALNPDLTGPIAVLTFIMVWIVLAWAIGN